MKSSLVSAAAAATATILLLIVGVQEALGRPLLLVDKLPEVVEVGEDDNYLLLNEEEVLHNADMLRYLASASKEEIEEIVVGNPSVQEALLKKIKGVIRLKESKKHAKKLKAIEHEAEEHLNNDDHDMPHSEEQFAGKYVEQQHSEQGHIDDIEDEESDDLIEEDIQTVELMKSRLKNHATRLYKIGKGLKAKLLAHRKRPKKDRPHFYFNVSTSSDSEKGASKSSHI